MSLMAVCVTKSVKPRADSLVYRCFQFSVFSQSIRENACAVIVCAYTDRHDDREINARVVTCVARWLIVCTCK